MPLSTFGWTYLSRSALRRAEQQLAGAGEGVRDEIGFLILHQRYADYFFPGTSVLHTRLRYALFVPWIYQTLFEEASTGRVADRLERQEIRLAGRLKHVKERGVIGGLNHPRPTTQPPSVSYWAALGTWGILRKQDGYSHRARSFTRSCKEVSARGSMMTHKRSSAGSCRFRPCLHLRRTGRPRGR
jgi:hypothetical protein